jgi:metallophosphoesterase (TIGR00282 family)
VRLLFIGDIMARAGRASVARHLPEIKARYRPDCVIANVDNAAHGIGVTSSVLEELQEAGIDVFTGGNHVWDRKESRQALSQYPHLVRPYNHVVSLPGTSLFSYTLPDGGKVLIFQLLGSLASKVPVENPFIAADRALQNTLLGSNPSAIFVDFHADITSEKMALAYYLDGRVSAVIGTHTHIPSCDTQILPKGTAYQTDTGMCGDYRSVIGMAPQGAIDRFLCPYARTPLASTKGEATFCGILLDIEPSGLARSAAPIRLGGVLSAYLPE